MVLTAGGELPVERVSLIDTSIFRYRIHDKLGAIGIPKSENGGPSMLFGPYLERR